MSYIGRLSYAEAIAKGLYTGKTSWSKIGYNILAAANTELDMAPQLAVPYVFPTAEKEMTVVSSSNTDNGALGQIKTYSITADTDRGSGYAVNDILTITQGGGALGSIKVLAVDAGNGNRITSSELHTCGTGYSAANDLPTVPVPTGGTGCLVNILTVSGAASTGARTVTLYYLDDAFVEKNVTVTLNGNTPVKLASDIYRCQNFRLTTTGTGLVPVGFLTVASGGVTYMYMSLGRTRARQCIWTVPDGKVLYINSVNLSAVSGSKVAEVRFTTRATFDNLAGTTTGGIFIPYHEIMLQDNVFHLPLDPPTKFTEGVDLKISAVSDQTVPQLTCSLRGWTETV